MENIIKKYEFYSVSNVDKLKTEIADLVYMLVTCDYETVVSIQDKIYLASEFYKKIVTRLQQDLNPEENYLGALVQCAKECFNLDTLEQVLTLCRKEINKAFDELGIVVVDDFSDVFDLLEIIDEKIAFPLKWFSPDIYKSVSEFLKTFDCERTKIKKQTAFKNLGEFSNEQILSIGKKLKGVSLSTKFDFFPTPEPLVKKVQELAEIQESDFLLEPSAGTGSLLKGVECRNITCVEISPILGEILREKKYYTHIMPFEEFENEHRFTKIIMNPPFSKRLDAKHIKRAFDMLEIGGRLVAIHSVGILTADDKASRDFRELCNGYLHYQEKISAGAFANSAKGTNIETCITVLDKN